VADGRRIPDDPVLFVSPSPDLVDLPRQYGSAGRFIPREAILAGADSHELVESYPDDKYLPSYLLLAQQGPNAFPVLFAVNVEGDNVRVVTSYRPDARSGSRTSRRGGHSSDVHGVWSRTAREDAVLTRVDEILASVGSQAELEIIRYAA
jgi:hypothetical protein